MRIAIAGLMVAAALALAACGGKVLDESFDVEVGDCVLDPGTVAELEELEAADCDDPDAVRVVTVFDITGYDEFPGEAAIDFEATQKCDVVSSGYIGPTEESWEGADDRTVICFDEGE